MAMSQCADSLLWTRARIELDASLAPHRRLWPADSLADDPRWRLDLAEHAYVREMPERQDDLARDSRWPAMFPSSISLVTVSDGETVALEREVGAAIVNRFPYVAALSVCRKPLSARHHPRRVFGDILERGGCATLQFLPPGPALDRALAAIAATPDARATARISASGLATRPGVTSRAPVFAAAYMAYEATLVRPGLDFDGNPVFPVPWVDVGSHRVYFLEIKAIQLREDIARGDSQIRWRALPAWEPRLDVADTLTLPPTLPASHYQKGYTPCYAFPADGTVAFEADEVRDGMAVKYLPRLPRDQVQVDNDKARWPCFFPSSMGLITSWTGSGEPNVMPCGSTTVVARHPFTIAPCISYARINVRYGARASLGMIRATGRFGCAVASISDAMVSAIKYLGNNSFADDCRKVARSGLAVGYSEYGPVPVAAPVHFDCAVVGEVPLGTHVMLLGEVRRIRVRADVGVDNPIEWSPWAAIAPVPGHAREGGQQPVGI